jgi:hypothetical protein
MYNKLTKLHLGININPELTNGMFVLRVGLSLMRQKYTLLDKLCFGASLKSGGTKSF